MFKRLTFSLFYSMCQTVVVGNGRSLLRHHSSFCSHQAKKDQRLKAIFYKHRHDLTKMPHQVIYFCFTCKLVLRDVETIILHKHTQAEVEEAFRPRHTAYPMADFLKKVSDKVRQYRVRLDYQEDLAFSLLEFDPTPES